MKQLTLIIVIVVFNISCATRNSQRSINDEISEHGENYVIEYDGTNKDRNRHERMYTWHKKGIGTHIAQAYQKGDNWIVFQINDEKKGSKW